MLIPIDGAGRLVIPKRIRDRLGLRPGDQLEVEEDDGQIRLRRPQRSVELIESEHGILTASAESGLPGLGPDEVRALLERSRR